MKTYTSQLSQAVPLKAIMAHEAETPDVIFFMHDCASLFKNKNACDDRYITNNLRWRTEAQSGLLEFLRLVYSASHGKQQAKAV
jgi:hypothetical protein